MKKWVTFDLDGTLMQNPFVDHVFPEIERLILEQDRSLVNVLPDILSEHGLRKAALRFVEAYDWDDIVSIYLAERGLSSINVEELVCQFCSDPAIYLLEDGIIKVLEEVKARGYSLAAVTNGYLKYQLPVMDALNLTPLFDVMITPESAGYAKPDPRMFQGIQGEIIYHVGDRVEDDIRSANGAGIRSVWMNRNLPKQICQLPIKERGKHPEMDVLVLTKLIRETKTNYTELPNWAKPDTMICSITELLDLC